MLRCVLEVAGRGLAERLGATAQANLLRTPDDVETLIAAGVHVRLVKGAYLEPPDRALAYGEPTDIAYLRLAHRLAAAGGPFALATHDGVLREALLAALGAVSVEQMLPRDSASRRGASVAGHDGVAAPLLRVDVSQRLSQHPPVAKRVEKASLAFAVLPVVRLVRRVGAGRASGVEHRIYILDAKHHLATRPRLALIDFVLTHNDLGSLAVEAKLSAMAFADADVLDQPQHVYVPGDRVTHIGNRQHRNDTRPRRRPIPRHASHSHEIRSQPKAVTSTAPCDHPPPKPRGHVPGVCAGMAARPSWSLARLARAPTLFATKYEAENDCVPPVNDAATRTD